MKSITPKPTSTPGVSTIDTKPNIPLSTPMSNTVQSMSTLSVSGERRIGIYTLEERRARINKFLAKRKRRIWKKRIKYDCRKKLADSRPRIKGRFVRRDEGDEDSDDIEGEEGFANNCEDGIMYLASLEEEDEEEEDIKEEADVKEPVF